MERRAHLLQLSQGDIMFEAVTGTTIDDTTECLDSTVAVSIQVARLNWFDSANDVQVFLSNVSLDEHPAGPDVTDVSNYMCLPESMRPK